jgi:hypothetical protein
MPREVPTAFFSYSRDDSAFAVRLAQDLKAAGASVWIDQLDIEPGQEWDSAIEAAVTRSPRMLLILSPASVKSRNVRNEISLALDENRTIIPVLYQDCTVPLQLRRVQYIDLRTDYSRGVNILLKTLAAEQRAELEQVERKRDVLPVQSNDLLTGPLTISAVLKGPERRIVGDAYPTGDNGVHFVFSLFNGNAFDFLVNELDVDVLAYAPLNLDHLAHGVGATAVRRYFRATIRPECGSYVATYVGRHVEFVTIPPGKSEGFDVEISTRTEGLYDVCLRVHGGSAGKGFDGPLDFTKRRVAFFDRGAGYMVDRGLGGRMLTYNEYSLEMKSWGLSDY